MTVRIKLIDLDEGDNHYDFANMQAICFPEDDQMAPVKRETWWWFAMDGDRPCGFACLTRGYKVKTLGYLAWAGVLPMWRGQGIQRKFIRARVLKAQELGLQRVITYTLNTNPASSNNLIKEGFKLYLPSAGWNMGAQALYWRKKL